MIHLAPILEKNYDFLLLMIPILQAMPKNQKFLLADRMQNIAMDNQNRLLQAYFSQDQNQKINLLQEVNIALEQLRFYTQLAKDLQLMNQDNYKKLAQSTNEIGAMNGGWIKSIKNKHSKSSEVV